MKRGFVSLGMLAAVCAGPALVGCDRTVSKKETTRVRRDGSVVRQSDTVSERPDGTVVHEQEKTVNH